MCTKKIGWLYNADEVMKVFLQIFGELELNIDRYTLGKCTKWLYKVKKMSIQAMWGHRLEIKEVK